MIIRWDREDTKRPRLVTLSLPFPGDQLSLQIDQAQGRYR
jgi:hypothetical protein